MESNLLALVLSQLWQVTLLVLAVAILVRLLARNRPHLAYALWLVVLVKCVTPPVWSSPSGVFCWLLPARQAAIVESTVMPEPVWLATPREDLIIPRKELKSGEALVLEISEPAEASATSRRTFVLVTSEIVVIQQEAKQPIAIAGRKNDRS